MPGWVKIEKARLQFMGFFVLVLLLHLSAAAAIMLTPRAELPASMDGEVQSFEVVNIKPADVKSVVETVKAETPPTPPVKVVPPPPPPPPKAVARPEPPPPIATPDEVALPEPVEVVTETSDTVTEEVTEPVVVNTPTEPATDVVVAEAPAATAATAAPLAMSDDYVSPDLAAAYRTNPPPPYPLMARRRGLEGVVVLIVHLDEAGRPLQVEVKQSSGHGILDETALQSVRNWRFVPAQRGGRSVEAAVEVPLRFALR